MRRWSSCTWIWQVRSPSALLLRPFSRQRADWTGSSTTQVKKAHQSRDHMAAYMSKGSSEIKGINSLEQISLNV